MACDTLIYEGKEYSREEFMDGVVSGEIYLPPNARASVANRLAMASQKGVSFDELTADAMSRPFKVMPFKFSSAKIVSGQKTITVRPGVYDAGTYRDSASQALFNVIPEGNMRLDEYLAATGMAKEDFKRLFIGAEEIKQPHIKEFLDGLQPLNIYSIRKVESQDDVIPEGSDPRYARLYENRMALIDKLKGERKKAKGDKKQAIQHRIDLLQDQVNILKSEDSHTINTIVDMMEEDLDTVERLLNSGADRSALEYATGLLYNYANLLDQQFREDIELLDPDDRLRIMAFQTRNTKMAERIIDEFRKPAIDMVRGMTGHDIEFLNGVPIYKKDINFLTRKLLDTSTDVNPIVQVITKYIANALTKFHQRFEAFKNVHRKLVKNLKAYQKAAGLGKDQVYDYMIQVDEDGKRTGNFVDKLSHQYTTLKGSLKGRKRLLFYANNHTFTVDPAANKARKDALKEWYKANLAHYAELTDLDIQKGITFDDKLAKQARSYASKSDAVLMAKILLKAKDNPGQIVDEEVEFFENFLTKKGGFRPEMVNGVETHPIQMHALPQWEDPMYNAIMALDPTDPRRAFYEHFAKTYKDGRKSLSDEEFYLPWNYIPEKTKNLGVVGTMQQQMVDSVSQNISSNVRGLDPVTGEIIKSIPIYTMGNTLSPEDKSYDLGDVLEQFESEVINHDEKSQIEDPCTLLQALLKDQRIPQTNADGSVKIVNGQVQFEPGLTNRFLQTQYKIAANLYDERQEKEGVTKKKVQNVLTKRKVAALREQMANLGLSEAEEQEAWGYIQANDVYLGPEQKIYDFVNLGQQAKALRAEGKNFSWGKVVDSLIHFTTIKLLGLNVLGSVGELLQGWTSIITEGAAGRYFTTSEAISAFGTYFTVYMGMDSTQKTKLHNMAQFFGAYVNRASQDNNVSGKIGKIAFAPWEVANKSTNVMYMISMLKHERIIDRAGVEHSLMDVLDVDEAGNFTLEGDFDEMAEQTKINLIHKYKELIKENRERQTFEDPIELEKNVVGRVLGQFKKNWFFTAIYSRFGEYREADLKSGMEKKGYYRSFLEQFKLRTIKDEYGTESTDWSAAGIAEMMGRVLKSIVQYSTWGRRMGVKPGQQSDLDQANLRKFMREMGLIIAVTITITILSSMGGDDDKSRLRRYSINQMIRLQRDLSSYMDPSALASHLKNPAPILGTVTDLLSIGGAAIQSGIFMDPYTHSNDPELRILKAIEKNIPLFNQYDRLMTKLDKTITYKY